MKREPFKEKMQPSVEVAEKSLEYQVEQVDMLPEAYISIRENMELRNQRIPEIKALPNLALDELLERESVNLEQLESHFVTKLQELFDATEQFYGVDVENIEPVELMYQLYLASQFESEKAPELLSNFSSFEAFKNAYCRELPSKQIAAISQYIQFYHERFVQDSRIISGRTTGRNVDNPYMGQLQSHDPDGDWVLMPERNILIEKFTFIEQGVVNEIVNLIDRGYRAPDYSHTTGSAALAGIGEQQCLLSSSELTRRNLTIQTGEVIREKHVNKKLGNVYASRGNPHDGYQVLHWFDEYQVSFGINEAKQKATIAGLSIEGEEILDWGGEGVLLGKEVHIQNVDVIYYKKKYEEEIQAWVKEYKIDADLVSLEAVNALNQFGELVNNMALEEDIEPRDAWNMLIEMSA